MAVFFFTHRGTFSHPLPSYHRAAQNDKMKPAFLTHSNKFESTNTNESRISSKARWEPPNHRTNVSPISTQAITPRRDRERERAPNPKYVCNQVVTSTKNCGPRRKLKSGAFDHSSGTVPTRNIRVSLNRYHLTGPPNKFRQFRRKLTPQERCRMLVFSREILCNKLNGTFSNQSRRAPFVLPAA